MQKLNRNVAIIHNILTPYKIVLFNELAKRIDNFIVIFIAESEKRRDWKIDWNSIHFNHKIVFKGMIEDVNKRKIYQGTIKILNEVNPDTLIICDYSNIFGWAALRWGKKNKSNLVFWLDSTQDDRKHYFPKEQVKQYFLKHFKVFLAPGKRTRQYLEYMQVDKSMISETGYGVDNNYYIEQYKKHFHNQDSLLLELGVKKKHNFIYIGRFSSEKNIFTLLKAFLELNSYNNDWGMILLGDGPLKDDINNYVVNNSLTDKITLPGFVQQNEIMKYLILSDVFVLPSYSEPWGLVVNEAMLAKLPIIISIKCGCQPELVKEEINGFSFDPNDLVKLKNTMHDFMSGKLNTKLLGENSFEIISNFSIEKISDKIIHSINQYL